MNGLLDCKLETSKECFNVLLNLSEELNLDEESTMDFKEVFMKIKPTPFLRKRGMIISEDINRTLSTLSGLKSKLNQLQEVVKSRTKIIEKLDKENSILSMKKEFLRKKLRIKLKKMRDTKRCCSFSNLFN
jgi:hypothetical protein